MKKILLFPLLISLTQLMLAQNPVKLKPDTLGISVFYGTMVDLKGELALVGSGPGLLFPPKGPYVYLFQEMNGQWELSASLVANDSTDSFFFDADMTLNGSKATVFVGDVNNDQAGTNAGAAYVFEYDVMDQSWFQVAKLTAGTFAEGQAEFGTSVSVDGDYAIVGSPKKDISLSSPNPNDGAAIIFEKDAATGSWILQEELQASDFGPEDRFGQDVAISGNYALIGSSFADSLASGVWGGAAYFFERTSNGWIEKQKVISSIRSPFQVSTDNFGWSVDINGNYAIVGAYTHVIGQTLIPGMAAVYEKKSNVWEEVAVLVPSDSISSGAFGFDVSIDANGNAAVAAFSSTKGASAYVYKRVGADWIEQSPKINLPDGATTAVALDGDRLIFGGSDINGGFSNLYSGVCTGGVNIEAIEESAFNIYPNPAQNRIWIEGINSSIRASLLNLEGRLIQEKIINEYSPFMELDGIPKGRYILSLEENGKQSNYKLLVTH